MGTLDDKDAIRELLAIYNRCIDFPDPDGWVATWTDDGEMYFGDRPPISGIEALRARAENRPGGSLHLTTNVVVHVDGDRALATSYVALIGGPDDPRLQLAGRYDDDLRRVDGHWRFAVRRLTPVHTATGRP